MTAVKRRSEEGRSRAPPGPAALSSVVQSTVLDFSTANPMMLLLLTGAAFICWTNPGLLTAVRGGAGWFVWLGMIVWLACFALDPKRSKQTWGQIAMGQFQQAQRDHEP